LIAMTAFGLTIVAGDEAGADTLKCQRAIAKAGAQYAQARAKALGKCEVSKVSGKLALATDCESEAKTESSLTKAADKLSASIDKACGGADKVCDGTNDDTAASLGWPATCPDFETEGCTNAIGLGCQGIATCVQCIHSEAVNQAMELYAGALNVENPILDKTLNKCQQTIIKATQAFLNSKSKALQKCWDARLNGKHMADCPDPGDGKAAAAIQKAEQKKIDSICKACGGADKVCGGGDDLTPTQIGFAPDCPDVVVPGGANCEDASVTSLGEIVACVDCVTEFKVDCMDRAQVPEFGAYPSECNPVTGPTPTATETPTATPTPTSSPTPCTPADVPAGLHARQVVVEGVTRTYDLYVPSGCVGVACPLVLDFHGFTSNKSDHRLLSGFGSLADLADFVVAFPQGRFGLPAGNPDGESPNPLDGPSWNAGACCGRAVTDAAADVAFARTLVGDASCQTPVDASRVYATGLSNGGGMAHRLACEAADVFAAVAPIASPLLLDPLSSCVPARSVPIIHLAGLTDPIVPYAGGTVLFPEDGPACSPTMLSIGTVPSAAASLARWRDLNGCGTGGPDQTIPKGTGACEVYDTSCPAGVEVQLCSITGDNGAGNSFACFFVPSCYDGHVLYCTPDIANVALEAWTFLSRFALTP
jgi:polyhydroxybutyrate depolymerase